ncbi:hypothetical protein AGMMS50225_11980 [Betaproteobacteria bacterium]|nr:hypothetical protein AGMMS50225_11980 [Betaproteobacteria bacterium]
MGLRAWLRAPAEALNIGDVAFQKRREEQHLFLLAVAFRLPLRDADVAQGVYQLVRQFYPADVAQSFMAIRKTVTDSGRQVTFKADRSEEVAHADLAWATMHALAHEPLAAGERGRSAARMEILE